MTRSLACFSISLSLCLALASPAAGQAGVEAGLGAARAATTTAPARGIGKSIGGLSGAIDKALKPGQQSSSEQPHPVTAATPAAKAPITSATASAAPAPNWEDPGTIETGLSYEDLIRRYGPPIMSIANTAGKSLTYRGKEGYFQVETKDGKVSDIARP